MDAIRLFIAIELPEPVKAGLKRVQDTLRLVDPSCAKWVDPGSIHLTLKFLGNVDSEKVDGIVRLMDEASQEVRPFRLELKGLGAFPNLRRVQVVWVGVAGDLDHLKILQKKLEDNLAELGFPSEGRAFTPHLTLARLREDIAPAGRESLGAAIGSFKLESNLVIEVNSLSLMKSQLTRAGAIYTQLASIKLKSPC